MCLMCREEHEDLWHLLISYRLATGVWSKVGDWLGIQFRLSLNIYCGTLPNVWGVVFGNEGEIYHLVSNRWG